MAEYYAVQRSADYLTHSGVKGMKWGIRKEREKTGIERSKAYNNAKRKLQLATMGGGLVGGLAYAATHKNEMKTIGKGSSKSSNKGIKIGPMVVGSKKYVDEKVKQHNSVKFSSKDKEFVKGMHKASNKGGLVGALTFGGGIGGSAISTAKYIHDHPKEYASYKKKFKQASFKDRMKMLYG